MPSVNADGVSLRYETNGSGPAVVFVNDVGFGAWLWSYQHAAVAGPYEATVWDLRGTGESDAPEGPYALSTLVSDLAAVVSATGSRRVHLVGAGLGGVIALEYARRHERAASLAVLGTAPGDAVDEDALSAMAAPTDDPAALAASLDTAFAPGVPEAHPDVIEQIAEWRGADDAEPPAGIRKWVAMLEPVVRDGLEDPRVDEEASAGLVDQLVEYNVDRQVAALVESDAVPADLTVVGVVYDFQDSYTERRGEVHVVNVDGDRDVASLREENPEVADRIRRRWTY